MTYLNPALLSSNYHPGFLHPFMYIFKISDGEIYIYITWHFNPKVLILSFLPRDMLTTFFQFRGISVEALHWNPFKTYSCCFLSSPNKSCSFHVPFSSLCTFLCIMHFWSNISVQSFLEKFFLSFLVFKPLSFRDPWLLSLITAFL